MIATGDAGFGVATFELGGDVSSGTGQDFQVLKAVASGTFSFGVSKLWRKLAAHKIKPKFAKRQAYGLTGNEVGTSKEYGGQRQN